MTKRSAVCVAEKAATLLSIRPAAFRDVEDLFVAEGGRLPFSRDDPDRAVRSDAGGQHREWLEVGGCLGAEQDHVGLGLGLALGQVGRPLCDRAVGSRGRRCRSGRRASPGGSRACRAAAWCRRVPSPVSCHAMLLVYGPRSASYDFGPGHPLTPRRFGPGIELMRAVGAEPGLAPEPAPDDELLWSHSRRYIDAVKRFSVDPFGPPEAGIGEGGDDPPFAGMHEAGAMVAGGSIRGIEAVLRGDVEHAFHPGGGLHHAMPDRASGFCIYDDPALAIARARRDGLRVLYVDLDVHHGDGVQAIHWADPGVLTLSFHESGRYLFPGTGGVGELGEGAAAGTSVNVPLEPETGEGAWLAAVQVLLPELAAAFGPDLIVSQHGADTHAWDPLAHLRVTTTAMGEAARLVDRVAHRYARRSLAGDRWRRVRRVPGRATQLEPGLAGRGASRGPVGDARRVARALGGRGRALRAGATPRDVRGCPERGRRDGRVAGHGRGPRARDGRGRAAACRAATASGRAGSRLVGSARVELGRRVLAASGRQRAAAARRSSIPTPRRGSGSALRRVSWRRQTRLRGTPSSVRPSRDGASVTAAVEGTTVVGLAIAGPTDDDGRRELLALGVAPSFRRQGLATALLEACVTAGAPATPSTRPTSPSPNATRSNRSIESSRRHRASPPRTDGLPDPLGRPRPKR